MSNKKDNFKEKEIKREVSLKEKELENAYGGWGEFLGHGSAYHVNTRRCNCKTKQCMEACFHKAIFIGGDDHVHIDQDKCTGCWTCDAKNACDCAAIYWSWSETF